jgi:hypothetical protein
MRILCDRQPFTLNYSGLTFSRIWATLGKKLSKQGGVMSLVKDQTYWENIERQAKATNQRLRQRQDQERVFQVLVESQDAGLANRTIRLSEFSRACPGLVIERMSWDIPRVNSDPEHHAVLITPLGRVSLDRWQERESDPLLPEVFERIAKGDRVEWILRADSNGGYRKIVFVEGKLERNSNGGTK